MLIVNCDLNFRIILFFFIDVIIVCLTSSHLNMSSTHDYNTRSKEMSDCKILVEISKLREELVENF